MNYKKCQCLKCGNVFLSKRNNPRCIKGTEKGCNSTINNILEIVEVNRTETKKVEVEQIQEVEQQKESFFTW